MQGPHLPLVSAVRAEGGAAAGAGETLRLQHRAGLRGAVDPARSQEARRVRPSVRGTALGLWLHLETLQAPWSLQGPRAEGREAGVRWFSLPSTLALNTCSGGELAGPHRPPTCPPRGAACVPPGRVRPWRPPRQVLPAPPAPQLRRGRTGGEHAGKGGCSPGARSPPPASAETRLPESARRASESSLRLTLKPVIHVFMGPKRLPGESAQVD